MFKVVLPAEEYSIYKRIQDAGTCDKGEISEETYDSFMKLEIILRSGSKIKINEKIAVSKERMRNAELTEEIMKQFFAEINSIAEERMQDNEKVLTHVQAIKTLGREDILDKNCNIDISLEDMKTIVTRELCRTHGVSSIAACMQKYANKKKENMDKKMEHVKTASGGK